MSNERKPLLSEDDEFVKASFPGRKRENNPSLYEGMRFAVGFYENLITSGKLRVVEEVEFKGNGYDCLLKCDGCGWSIGWHIKEDLQPMPYCPGCGNPIKRQSPADQVEEQG